MLLPKSKDLALESKVKIRWATDVDCRSYPKIQIYTESPFCQSRKIYILSLNSIYLTMLVQKKLETNSVVWKRNYRYTNI